MSSCGCGQPSPCACGEGNLIGSLNIDSILGVRDSIGAALHKVSLVTRTWSGKKPGDGEAEDVIARVLPTPNIKDFSHSLRVLEGGSVKQGDIILEGISKNKYPKESQIDGLTGARNVERFYLIDDRLYVVISVVEKLLTWNVQIRKYSSNALYGDQNG